MTRGIFLLLAFIFPSVVLLDALPAWDSFVPDPATRIVLGIHD